MGSEAKLGFLGIGPRIAWFTFPALAVAITASYLEPQLFLMNFIPRPISMVAGWIFLIPGLIFYAFTASTLAKGIRLNMLLTTGTFSLCRNPLYADFIYFIFPSVGLLTNSWLVLACTPVAYLAFKMNIHLEYEQLERIFGEDYKAYAERTRELLPIPKRKRAVSESLDNF